MVRHSLVVALALGIVSCKGSTSQAPADPEPPRPDPTEVAAEEPVAPEAPTAPAVAPSDAPSVDPDPGETPTAPTFRDLESELRAAVGEPIDCLRDFRPSTARTIRVTIGAVIRPSGMIIEPSASGAGLSTNDRRCIEERVGAVTLPPLGGASSESVTTALDLRYVPPTVAEEYDVAQPPPPREGVVQALPKKQTIAPSGVPIEGPAPDPIEGPDGVPISGPKPQPIEGPKPVPIGSE